MEKIIGDLEKQIETLKAENEELRELLREVESQLNDRGGFDILRASINEVIKI